MIKQEINEIKKLFTQSKCSITRICGCYVDGEKNKKAHLKEAFLSLPEEDMFKYFELLRKTLSGTLGRNLLNMEFPLSTEEAGGTQEFLLRLRNSKLKDEGLLDAFYDKVIESYDYPGNYLILLIHDVYDIPGKTTDGITMEDASDEVYEYLLCTICPVNLSKPGLSYNLETNSFQNRIRDWIVEMPDTGFLFPAFNDRSCDLHGTLVYTKDANDLPDSLIEHVLGCTLPLSAGSQKEAFQVVIEETLGEQCDYEVVKNIHEKLNEMVEEYKDVPEPLSLNKQEVKSLLESSGVEEKNLELFEQCYDAAAGEKTSLMVNNVFNTRAFEVKTPDISIKVNPERLDLVEQKMINGRPCLVIAMSDQVEVNGIPVRSIPSDLPTDPDEDF